MTTHALGAESATFNRRLLQENHTLAVSLIGNSGSGKTSLIETTVTRLWDMQIGVIIGHPAADRDLERLSKLVRHVIRIDEWPLDPEQVQQCLTRLDLPAIDLLLIEVGGGAGGIEHADVGQDLRVGVFSVSGGDDKLAEFPERAAESDLLVLTKIDLVPYMPFNLESFRADARQINPAIPLVEVSIVTREGLRDWEEWLRRHIQRRRPAAHAEQAPEPEWFFG